MVPLEFFILCVRKDTDQVTRRAARQIILQWVSGSLERLNALSNDDTIKNAPKKFMTFLKTPDKWNDGNYETILHLIGLYISFLEKRVYPSNTHECSYVLWEIQEAIKEEPASSDEHVKQKWEALKTAIAYYMTVSPAPSASLNVVPIFNTTEPIEVHDAFAGNDVFSDPVSTLDRAAQGTKSVATILQLLSQLFQELKKFLDILHGEETKK